MGTGNATRKASRTPLPSNLVRKGSLLLIGLLVLSLVEGLLPFAVSANGGIKEVAEGKYMVNLSAAPIAPYVGEKQSMLLGFADIFGNLIEKDISVDLTLKYQHETLLEQKNLIADNGVLPFQYTYEEPGLYELFVAFRLPDELEHTYMPEDFMIDVKEKYATTEATSSPVFPILLGGVIGFLIGFLIGKRAYHFPPFL